MENKIFITVLLASYNSSKTIYETLDSIMMQKGPSLEVIVCDDGSEDFDGAAIREYVKKKRPQLELTLLHQPQNIGTVRNLNAGLDLARGEWVMTLAADDCFAEADSITHLLQRAEKFGCRWVTAKTALCDEKLIQSGQSVPAEEIDRAINEKNHKKLLFALCKGCCLAAGGTIYQTQMLKEMGGFDEDYRLTEDWPLFIKQVRQGILPAVTEKEVVLHRSGGVSRKKAGKNFAYQKDLITVLRKEVVPYLDTMDKDKKTHISRVVKEKELSFTFRFGCKNQFSRLVWSMRHPCFIVRKIFRKREKIC